MKVKRYLRFDQMKVVRWIFFSRSNTAGGKLNRQVNKKTYQKQQKPPFFFLKKIF